ncbi:MAG: rhomboid family intramembrane serine protease [Chlorobi bacterium]|nr:rhomboid family intramembrane serine protease [Chlorobiota bacterium]
MIPIKDDNVVGGLPFVNYSFIVINLLVFALLQFPLMGDSQKSNDFIMNFGAVPSIIEQNQKFFTIITSMFLHGGIMHLLGNMVFLWRFGDNIEKVMGSFFYFLFYMIGGIVALFAHLMTNHGSNLPCVGASGAISAVLGAYIIMFPKNRVKVLWIGYGFGMSDVSALYFLGIWGAMQFVNGLGALGGIASGVAFWAHIGGFVAGVVGGYFLRNKAARMKVIPMYNQNENFQKITNDSSFKD